MVIKVTAIKQITNFKLVICFNTGDLRIFDFVSLLSDPAFAPLIDEERFKK